MEDKLGAIKIVRTLATFLCGIVCPFLLYQLDSRLEKPYVNLALPLLISFGPFILAGVAGCAIMPRRPYRAVSTVVIGVFVGSIINLFFVPTLSNIFPLEIIANTIMAVFCCLLAAALWRLGSDIYFFVSKKNSA